MATIILDKVRRKKKVSKKELARRLKKDYRTTQRFYKDDWNPRFDTLSDVAKALKCRVRDLIKED